MTAPIADLRAGSPPVEACWSVIGVSGDRSCPELAIQVHCRNCPVYAGAAVTFLDQDMPEAYLAELTAYVARAPERQEGATHAVIIFRLGGEWLAFPMLALEEVVKRRPIHSLPHRRGGVVLGLVNVRGALLICVSLTRLMALDETQEEDHAGRRLLVISDHGQRLAAPVDEVGGIFRYRADEVKALPDTVAKGAANFTKATFAWKDRTIGLLDEQRLLPALNRSVA
ncbi:MULTISPECIES: chemotaxis protein CheW [Rhodomicrobium]|uniref:chemotaxis protein CheW n=1 Tax=Rhodomicrobium TaxID=1068 RepID=UPI000B4B28F6|nr:MULTISPECIES: chemotaxis protein CheW [Rhodomicrobium]